MSETQPPQPPRIPIFLPDEPGVPSSPNAPNGPIPGAPAQPVPPTNPPPSMPRIRSGIPSPLDTHATASAKHPSEWAREKEHLTEASFFTHIPWEYESARRANRWPDKEVDPSFTISEADYDKAIKAAY